VVDLTLKDLATSSIWEFALDEEGVEGQDETTVRPYAADGLLDSSAGMFVVRARFVLADGTLMSGYLTPPVQGQAGLSTFQPIIITPDGQVVFWCGMRGRARKCGASLSRDGLMSCPALDSCA
jgi:hypothetical protein